MFLSNLVVFVFFFFEDPYLLIHKFDYFDISSVSKYWPQVLHSNTPFSNLEVKDLEFFLKYSGDIMFHNTWGRISLYMFMNWC